MPSNGVTTRNTKARECTENLPFSSAKTHGYSTNVTRALKSFLGVVDRVSVQDDLLLDEPAPQSRPHKNSRVQAQRAKRRYTPCHSQS
jgi:hypothetical protein